MPSKRPVRKAKPAATPPDTNSGTASLNGRLPKICALIAAGIALLALAGWQMNARFLAGQWGNYIPMAPSTALAFLLLGGALFSYARWPGQRWSRLFALAALSLVTSLSLLVLGQFITGIDLGLEQALLRANETIGQMPLGRMSPLTALSFLLESAALFILLIGQRWRHASTTAALHAGVATAINLVVLTGYAYGAPLLYGGPTIPTAFPTAAAFAVMGIGLIGITARDAPALRAWSRTSLRGRLLRAILPPLLLLLLLEGWLEARLEPLLQFNLALWHSLAALAVGILILVVTGWIVRNTADTIEQAQAALRGSENRFRAIVEHSLEEVSLIAADGTLIYESPTTRRPLGYPSGAFVGRSILDLFHPDDRAAALQLLAEVVQQPGASREATYRLRHQDGSWRWMEGVTTNLLDEPAVRAVVINYRDITLRKRGEEALRESEEYFRSLIGNVSDIITVLDSAGTILYESPSIERVLGYKPEELLGQNAFELVHPEELAATVEALARGLQSPESSPLIEARLRHKDGSWRVMEMIGKPALDRAEQVIGIVNARDITERKRAEAELLKLRMAVNASGEVIFMTDRDGLITFVNPEFTRLYGYAAEEVVGKTTPRILKSELMKPEDYSTLWQTILSKQVVKGEFVNKTKDGRLLNIEGSINPVLDDGNIAGFLAIQRDVTDRKRAEAVLRASEERLRVGLNTANSAVFNQGLDLRYDWMYQPQLGYTSEQVTGHTDADLLPPEAAKQVMEIKRRVLEDGLKEHAEVPISVGGQTFVYDLLVEPLRDSSGVIIGLTGASLDITERKRAEEELRQRLAELESLHTVSAALRNASTRDEALPIVLDQTLAALETDAGAIWLYHPASGELRAAVDRGWYQQLNTSPMKPGEGIGGRVFTTGQTHLSTDLLTDPVTRPLAREQTPPGWGGACVAIRTGATVIGVLYISVPPPRQITSEQVQLLESLAEMAGAALHRMRLYEETVRQLARLQALRAIDQAIGGSVDLRMTLSVILEQAIAQLRVDAVDVLLFNPHLQTLEYAAGRGFRSRAVERTRFRIGEGQAGQAALERRMIQHADVAASGAVFAQAELLAAENVAAYYAVPLIAKGEVKGVLEIFHRSPLTPDAEWLNFLETLAGQAAIAIDAMQLFDNLQRSNAELSLAYDATIEGWSHALDLRDKETEGHTLRVTEMAMRLAQAMGIGEAELVHVRRGALLHDIGKMGVPDGILLKPGPLTDDEWKVMRLHPQFAYDMLSPIAYLRLALDIPYCHHERWDGTGYPRGLKGEQIPVAARLFAVVDAWDALRSDRPYRSAWPEKKVIEHINAGRGTHFDPKVVEAFFESDGVIGRGLERLPQNG